MRARRTRSVQTPNTTVNLRAQFPRSIPRYRQSTPAHSYATFSEKNHAILIGGGRSGSFADALIPPYSEEVSLQKMQYAATNLAEKFCPAENIRVLFGNGENHPKTIVAQPLWMRAIYHWQEKQLYVTHQEPTAITASSNTTTVENEFDRIANLPQVQRLFVYLDGHGAKYEGTLLWNTYINTELLGPMFLQKMLDKVHPETRIMLFVNSCSSGNFLRIQRQNLSVYTTSTLSRVSYYNVENIDELLQHWISYLTDANSNLLLAQARGSLQDGNFYACDSLTYFIDQNILKLMPQQWALEAIDIYQQIMLKLKGNRRSYIGDHIQHYGILLGLYLLPSESLFHQAMHLLGEVHSQIFLIKMSPVFIKLFLALFFSKIYAQLNEKFYNSDIYKKFPTVDDRLLIKLLDGILADALAKGADDETHVFINANQDQIIQVMSQLYELKQADLNKPVISKYTYLFDKALLFISISLLNKNFALITEFCQMAEYVLNPLRKKLTNEIAQAETKIHLSKHALFASTNLTNNNTRVAGTVNQIMKSPKY